MYFTTCAQPSYPAKDVLSRRMALRTHSLPSGRHKNYFRQIEEALFQGVERSCEIYFCKLGVEKSYLYQDA
jgi:hypothetical protein